MARRGLRDLLRPVREELDEDRAGDEPDEGTEPADHDADEQEDREGDRERVRIDERRRDREQRPAAPAYAALTPNASVL